MVQETTSSVTDQQSTSTSKERLALVGERLELATERLALADQAKADLETKLHEAHDAKVLLDPYPRTRE